MAKHMVVCVECGRQFDANHGGYYNSSTKRYTCKRCGKRVKKEIRRRQGDYNEQHTGMRQSWGSMIAKIAFGALFLIAGFIPPEEGWTVGYFLVALVVGGALISWGLLPYLQSRKKISEEVKARVEERNAEENETKVCSACGAVTKGKYCEYCGSKLG